MILFIDLSNMSLAPSPRAIPFLISMFYVNNCHWSVLVTNRRVRMHAILKDIYQKKALKLTMFLNIEFLDNSI